MYKSFASPFLDLATDAVSSSMREAIFSEFDSKLEAVSDEFEFDLMLWSLAQRLRVDTEELLRQVGSTWLRQSRYFSEFSDPARGSLPLEVLRDFLMRFAEVTDAPLPGMSSFSIESVSLGDGRLKIVCQGTRRCCSFLEGAARGICERYGVSLRYLRQPKRAQLVVITFSCIEG